MIPGRLLTIFVLIVLSFAAAAQKKSDSLKTDVFEDSTYNKVGVTLGPDKMTSDEDWPITITVPGKTPPTIKNLLKLY